MLNYFFDFGNVFINLDLDAMENKFKELGLNEITNQDIENINLYEKGLISTEKFINNFKSKLINASAQNIIDAWNSILLDFPSYRLKFIENFCKEKHCYLLSNINELHLSYITNHLSKDFYKRFIDSFEKIYYSHIIHLRKPDKEIYEYVLKDNQLNPKNCFFVDDKKENIETAKQMGFKTWHLSVLNDDIIYLEKFIK